jgi:ABC-type branched-subunit amino acid transport system permease subunit
MEYGITPWISIFFGMFISGVFAVLIGIPMLRLSGHYFAIATLLIGISFPSSFSKMGFSRCCLWFMGYHDPRRLLDSASIS